MNDFLLSIFALNLPLLIPARALAAHQESALANLWSMAGSLGNLLVLLAVVWFRDGLPWLVFGWFWFWIGHEPDLRRLAVRFSQTVAASTS